jgi:hypothetical protein
MALHRTDQEHPNADLVRRAHAAFKANDQAEISRLFAEDIVWTVGGEGPQTGTTVGMANVMANFGEIMQLTEGTYHAEPVDYLGSDDHAINISHLTAKRPDGRSIDIMEAVIFRVRDGRLVEAQHIAYDEKAWEEFFA